MHRIELSPLDIRLSASAPSHGHSDLNQLGTQFDFQFGRLLICSDGGVYQCDLGTSLGRLIVEPKYELLWISDVLQKSSSFLVLLSPTAEAPSSTEAKLLEISLAGTILNYYSLPPGNWLFARHSGACTIIFEALGSTPLYYLDEAGNRLAETTSRIGILSAVTYGVDKLACLDIHSKLYSIKISSSLSVSPPVQLPFGQCTANALGVTVGGRLLVGGYCSETRSFSIAKISFRGGWRVSNLCRIDSEELAEGLSASWFEAPDAYILEDSCRVAALYGYEHENQIVLFIGGNSSGHTAYGGRSLVALYDLENKRVLSRYILSKTAVPERISRMSSTEWLIIDCNAGGWILTVDKD